MRAVSLQERTVSVRRERVGGLGLSVKGGAEHNLPILISRIFKDQAADKTGSLFVGDAILQVNETRLEGAMHDDAVQCLKRAGASVTLIVKYFRPASLFLSASKGSEPNNLAVRINDVIDILISCEEIATIGSIVSSDGRQRLPTATTMERNRQHQPALCLHHQIRSWNRRASVWEFLVRFGNNVTSIDNYLNGVICFRSCGFEVINMDGVTTGAVQVDNTRLQGEWLQKISTTIGNINCNYVNTTIDLLHTCML